MRSQRAGRVATASAPRGPRRMRGQAATEYIVVIAAAIIVLAVVAAGNPLQPANGTSPSPVQMLVSALKGFWTHYSYLISLP